MAALFWVVVVCTMLAVQVGVGVFSEGELVCRLVAVGGRLKCPLAPLVWMQLMVPTLEMVTSLWSLSILLLLNPVLRQVSSRR